MGTLLLHDPFVQFYLLYVGVLWIAFFWAHLRKPSAKPDCSRTPEQKPVRAMPRLQTAAANKKPSLSVSRSNRPTD
jgi:hypothetical protein